MRSLTPLLALTLLVPLAAFAAPASFDAERTVVASSPATGNAYDAGAAVTVTAPTGGDLSAAGGSVTVAGDVAGDALLAGGSVSMRSKVAGDLRAAGGTISVDGPVGGDLVAFGYSVSASTPAKGSVFVAGASVSLTGGANGPVTVYGNAVTLGGDFKGDVTVTSSARLTLLASTTIAGKLSYSAPEKAMIPDSASVKGGIAYTNASYVPSASASRALAVASIGIFLLARVLGALLLAGLLAGLFPRLAEAITDRASGRARPVLLTMLLGFAAFVATPILLVLLALTLVGVGIAALLFMAYALLLILSFVYAGIVLGAFIARRFEHRAEVRWRDGVLGMLLLSLIMLLPFVGLLAAFLLMTFAAGALLLMFFHFAFPHEE